VSTKADRSMGDADVRGFSHRLLSTHPGTQLQHGDDGDNPNSTIEDADAEADWL